MHLITRFVFVLVAGLSLVACDTLFPPTPTPDYTIHVTQTPAGPFAIAPKCLDMTSATANPYDNQPLPQFGCANARNLAMMVERPNDLVQGRDFGDGSGVLAVGAMRRYYNNQTRGLIDLQSSPDLSVAATTAPTASSSMTGDAAASSGGSSSASSGGSAAAAP